MRYHRHVVQGKMKLVPFAIWILAALLVAATLDNVPDPPATSPRAVLCKVQPQTRSCGAALHRVESLAICACFFLRPGAVDNCEPRLPSHSMALAGRAADSSPPRAV